MPKQVLVKYQDQTEPIPCPYGNTTRIITGGEGGIANVHVVKVTDGSPHIHRGYDEVYYVLSGTGSLHIEDQTFLLRPGAVATIPRGIPHSVKADPGNELEFIIFGTPAISIEGPDAAPVSPED
jgi:mannose-6-phosphate isomerase-like protein (cupin superfamily)